MSEDSWRAALADLLRALTKLAEMGVQVLLEERDAARAERDRLARRRGGSTGDF